MLINNILLFRHSAVNAILVMLNRTLCVQEHSINSDYMNKEKLLSQYLAGQLGELSVEHMSILT